MVTVTFVVPAGVPVAGVLPQPTMVATSPSIMSSIKEYRRRRFLHVAPPTITMPRKPKPVSAAKTEPAPADGTDSIAAFKGRAVVVIVSVEVTAFPLGVTVGGTKLQLECNGKPLHAKPTGLANPPCGVTVNV